MKRIVLIIIVAAAISGAAFARGTGDTGGVRRGTGAGLDGESVTLSGVVEERDGRVVLVTTQGIYSLSAPGFYRSGDEVPLGEKVEVSGVLNAENCDDCDIDADGHVFVASATVDGEEITFASGRNGEGRGGNRNNAMNGGNGNRGRWSEDDSGRGSGNRGGGRGGSGPRYGQSTGA